MSSVDLQSSRTLLAGSMLALLLAACGGESRGNKGAPSGVGGAPAGVGGAPAGGGFSGIASAPLERIFKNETFGDTPAECAADGGCPVGMACFHLARELAVCDQSGQPESDQCTVPLAIDQSNKQPDQCGCGGLSCASGQACITAYNECSCARQTYNACVDAACQSPADCPSPSVCTPSSSIRPQGAPNTNVPAVGRCIMPACGSDADCTMDEGGRCSVVLMLPPQSGSPRLTVQCAYAGSASAAAACKGGAAGALVSPSGRDFHVCF